MIGSLLLTAALSAVAPSPMGDCKVSALWGTTLPDIPADRERYVLQVQAKRIFWNGISLTVDKAVARIAPDMAQGSDMLVIDASTGKCAVVKQLADAMEAPSACTPERCIVTHKPVPARKPETP